ncbi:O-methyltransferase, partial [Melampsora americana]
ILKEMIHETHQTDWNELYETQQTQIKLMSEMSSNSYEHGLIQFICDLIKPKRVLEIGMFTGTMTLMFSLNKEIEKVVSLEFEPFLEKWCRSFWKKLDEENRKIEVRIGSAFESLEKMRSEGEEAFDMILIDADKSSYSKYFNQIINYKLLSKNGILLIDNTIYKATTYSPFNSNLIHDSLKLNVQVESIEKINQTGEFLNELNQEILNHSEVDVVMLPIRDGLSLIKWKEL